MRDRLGLVRGVSKVDKSSFDCEMFFLLYFCFLSRQLFIPICFLPVFIITDFSPFSTFFGLGNIFYKQQSKYHWKRGRKGVAYPVSFRFFFRRDRKKPREFERKRRFAVHGWLWLYVSCGFAPYKVRNAPELSHTHTHTRARTHARRQASTLLVYTYSICRPFYFCFICYFVWICCFLFW